MNIQKTFILIIICLLLSATSAYSQDTLTWEECALIAIDNNPDLVSAAEEVKQAMADKDINLSPMLPQLDSEVTANRQKSSKGTTANTYSYGISGSQLVFDGFKTASDITGALKTMQSKQYNYAVVSSNIRLGLRSAFVALMRSQELISITEDIAQRRKQNLDLVKLRYEGGREHRGALLTAEADMAQAEFEIAQAKRSVTLAQRELFKELGLAKTSQAKAKGDFLISKNYSNKPDIDYLAQNTPFLQELMLRKEAARYNVNSKEADFFPKVYLNGSMGRTDDIWLPRNDEWSAGARITLPLFEGGRRISEVSKARSQLRQAGADEQSGYDSVLVTLERSWKDLQDAITNVSVQKKFLEAAQERAKITRAQYSTGLASFNDWIIIEDNLVKAQKAYLNIQADMLIAEAYWIQAIGGTLQYDEK